MAVAQATHDAILRGAIARADGYVFSTGGDGLAAAFPRAQDALAAAVESQRALAAQRWPESAVVSVRMGLHTGEAIERDGNYFGPPVIRAARLMALVGGGRIACSQTTEQVLRPHLHEGLDLLPMGTVPLKGLAVPEQVFVVSGPGLIETGHALDLGAAAPADELIRPLLPADRHHHDLPLGLSRFVGRTAELHKIADLLEGSRLVTLTGVGGVGKTRLALQAAARVADRYSDGVWLYELAPVAGDTAVPSTVAAAFGITANDPHGPPIEEQICDYLAARRVLLLLDNCEHVINGVAALVHLLLSHCPQVSVLATSRERLRVPGEAAFAVPPLALPPADSTDLGLLVGSDAVALFCERVRDTGAEFQLTDRSRAAVVRVCHRLDGIPLALELAAARTRMLTVKQIADGLDHCFGVLGRGARTAVPRQQTLRATLDWSYNLLAPAEQAALRRLAVFPDRFSLEAAISVVTAKSNVDDDEPDGFELVSRLVDKSLVEADTTANHVRYRLLEPIRQYAEEKLSEAAEMDGARRRHRDFFLADSSAWRMEVNMAPRVAADHANFKAALEWSWEEGDVDAALSLVGFMSSRIESSDVEHRQWLERVLAEPDPADHPGRAQAFAALAMLVQASGQPEPERAALLMNAATAMAARLGDEQLVAWVQFTAAELELAWGRSGEARALLDAALEAYERTGSPLSAGWCHEHLGWAAVLDEDFRRAHLHFERATELARGDDEGEGDWLAAHALAALAPVTALMGDSEPALHLAAAAIHAARGFPIPSVRTMALARAAETAILARAYDPAADLIVDLLGVLKDQATRRWIADALEMAALVLEANGDTQVAAAVLRAGGTLRTASGERPGGTRALATEVQEACGRLFGNTTGDDGPWPDPSLAPDAAMAEALAALHCHRENSPAVQVAEHADADAEVANWH